MRIIQVIPNFDMGGAERMCETLSLELFSLGHEVLVISLYSNVTPITDRLSDKGIKILFLDKRKGFDYKCVRKLKRIIKEFNPDVIHSHLYAIKYVALSTLFNQKIKLVHTIHNVAKKETSKINRIFNGFFFRSRIIPIALSDLVLETILQEYKLNKNRVPVILNGIDLSKCLQKNEFHADGKIVFINVARLSEQKNHSRLIDAFNLLRSDFSNIELLLVGEGEKRFEIESKVKKLHLEDNIKLLGNRTNVYNLLNSADVFVLSSDYEGIPMSVIEAMGTGLPIVSTNVGGLSDLITDGVEGFLTECNEISLYNAMKRIVSRNLYRVMGNKSKEKARLYSSRLMAEKYLEVYDAHNTIK